MRRKTGQEQSAARRHALAAEVKWMAAALQTARSYEARFLALTGLIRERWDDARIVMLAETLHPKTRYPNRAAAMRAVEDFRRQHSKLLLELLDDLPWELPGESAVQPFRAR